MHSVERQEQKVLLTVNVKFYCFHFILLLGVCVCTCVCGGVGGMLIFHSFQFGIEQVINASDLIN